MDASEFQAGRKAEIRAAKETRIQERLGGLQGDDLQKMVGKFDADGDGKVTVQEVLAGRREARNKAETARGDPMFQGLAPDGKTFQVADHQEYQAYDMDGDGAVSGAEFAAGQKADAQALRDRRYLDRSADPETLKRLGVDAAGRPTQAARITHSSSPVNVGGLQNLTLDQATEIVRSQGGKLLQQGRQVDGSHLATAHHAPHEVKVLGVSGRQPADGQVCQARRHRRRRGPGGHQAGGADVVAWAWGDAPLA